MSAFLKTVRASTEARIARGMRAPDGPVPGRRPSFSDALSGRTSLAVIAEIKRRSPALGSLAEDLDAVARARAYVSAGARAISVLTEPDHFHGSLEDLVSVASAVEVPVLMKDFVIDPRQVRIAAACGASAVLLILRMLDGPGLLACLEAAREEGLDVLLEVHDAAELDRALLHDGIIGINNRNLDSLAIDTTNFDRLVTRVPEGCIVVAESGYRDAIDLGHLVGRADAALVGTALSRTERPQDLLQGVVSCR